MTTQTANINGIDTQALKRTMAAVKQDPAQGLVRFEVTTDWQGGTRTQTRVDRWALAGRKHERGFTINIDEPAELLGENTAPNPQEYLMAAVNACLAATYVAACSMQGITLESLQIETRGELDLRGFLGLDKNVKAGYDHVDYTLRVRGDGTPAQFEAVHEWVKKTSPNYFNLANAVRLNGELMVGGSAAR